MTNGLDKGFCLLYKQLSYRRKFIRTLWTIAFLPLLLFLPQLLSSSVNGSEYFRWLFVLTILIGAAQAVYNYQKWKQEEHKQTAQQP